MVRVSYSKYSTWAGCPQKFKLTYIDKIGDYESSIALLFGTSLHETIQTFLEVMYKKSKKAALEIDLDNLLKESLIKNFSIEKKKMNGVAPCTQLELEEHYGDGRQMLRYFRSKLKKFYSKSGYDLVAIELKLEQEVKPGVFFIGYVDVIIKDVSADEIIIIDLKTAKKGWSSYQKNDKVKTSQMLLYKKFYSELYNVSMDKIKVEYQIFKRKIDEDSQYPIPRVSKFVPANGKPSVNKAYAGFMEFVDTVYADGGEWNKDVYYQPKPTKLCDWCSYKESGHCPAYK